MGITIHCAISIRIPEARCLLFGAHAGTPDLLRRARRFGGFSPFIPPIRQLTAEKFEVIRTAEGYEVPLAAR
jgi:hypothetical protein